MECKILEPLIMYLIYLLQLKKKSKQDSDQNNSSIICQDLLIHCFKVPYICF